MVDAADAFVVHRDLAMHRRSRSHTPRADKRRAVSESSRCGIGDDTGERRRGHGAGNCASDRPTTSVDLSVTISGGAGYTLGDPRRDARACRAPRPGTGPHWIAIRTSSSVPTATIANKPSTSAKRRVELTTTASERSIRLVDGELPPGISISEELGAQGEFLGTATTPGDYARRWTCARPALSSPVGEPHSSFTSSRHATAGHQYFGARHHDRRSVLANARHRNSAPPITTSISPRKCPSPELRRRHHHRRSLLAPDRRIMARTARRRAG